MSTTTPIPPTMPWWRTDNYHIETPIPQAFRDFAGAQGPALTRVWPNGKTDPGWGEDEFVRRYKLGYMLFRPIIQGYDIGRWAFAFVMRSMRLVCIDIDGKNGGLTEALKLGMLPKTLAETSKSGDGYHLFYLTEADEWDPNKGFAMFSDRIGIKKGVDFRGTGCVYHHSTQRWNDRKPVELPNHIKDLLLKREQAAAAQIAAITKTLDAGDQLEVVIMQDQLMQDLAKPIPAGRRNTTLFAIGEQMKAAGVPGWETLISDRALVLGLDTDEATKLVRNIQKYGA